MPRQTAEQVRRTIMVVEDFDDTRQMIAFGLRQEGYEVVEVSNGRDAVEAVKRRCPDLVLMDLSLPGWDGLWAAFRMRELESMCHVPIVACTAHAAAVHREVALEAGCDAYVQKPLDMEQLKGIVSRLLDESVDEVRSGAARSRARRIAAARMGDEELREYLDGLLERNVAPE